MVTNERGRHQSKLVWTSCPESFRHPAITLKASATPRHDPAIRTIVSVYVGYANNCIVNTNHRVVGARVIEGVVAAPVRKVRPVPEGHEVAAGYAHCSNARQRSSDGKARPNCWSRSRTTPKFSGVQGPDLQNILRRSYDYLTMMPKLRSTYDGRLVYKTSYNEWNAFHRHDSRAKS